MVLRFLSGRATDELVPATEGMTVGKLTEFVHTMMGKENSVQCILIHPGCQVRYLTPSALCRDDPLAKKQIFKERAARLAQPCKTVDADGATLEVIQFQ